MPVELLTKPGTQTEPFPSLFGFSDKISDTIILGAGSGTGRLLALRLATEHSVQVYAGTTKQANFDSLHDEITARGGIAPKPLVADIRNEDAFRNAFNDALLPEGRMVNYAPLAAGGITGDFLRAVVSMRGALRKPDQISPTFLADLTERIKANVTQPDVVAGAVEMNVKSPMRIFQMLKERGNINPESRLVNTSSSISKNSDPRNIESFGGPWFYYPVLFKQEGVDALRTEAMIIGGIHTDVVAPEVEDTMVGQNIDKVVDSVQKIEAIIKGVPSVTYDIPKINMAHYVDAIIADMMRPKVGRDRISDVFVTTNGVVDEFPQEWKHPLVPYL